MDAGSRALAVLRAAEEQADGAPLWLGVAALCVAFLALLVSAASLVWQFVQHKLTGSVVKVDLAFGAVGPRGAWTHPTLEGMRDLLARNPAGGPWQPVIVLRPRNSGRLGVQIEGHTIVFHNGAQLMGDERVSGTDKAGRRMEPGESAQFLVDLSWVGALAGAFTDDEPARIRGEVRLGTGETVRSEWVEVDVHDLPEGQSPNS